MSQTFAQILQAIPNTETRIALEMIFGLLGISPNVTVGKAQLKLQTDGRI
jgi:hypothetical protein